MNLDVDQDLANLQNLLPVRRRGGGGGGIVVAAGDSGVGGLGGGIRFDPELRAIGTRSRDISSRDPDDNQSRRSIDKTGQLVGMTRLLDFLRRPELDVEVELRFTGLPSACLGADALLLCVVFVRYFVLRYLLVPSSPLLLLQSFEQWWWLVNLLGFLLGVWACYFTATSVQMSSGQQRITLRALATDIFIWNNLLRSFFISLYSAPVRTILVSLHLPLSVLALLEERAIWTLLLFVLGSHLRVEDMKRKRKEAVVEILDVLRELRDSINEELGVGAARRRSLQDVFLEMDEDGSGTIDRMEFRRAMKRLRIPIGDREVDIVYLVYDPDKNGLDYHEFLELISYDGSEAKAAAHVQKHTHTRAPAGQGNSNRVGAGGRVNAADAGGGFGGLGAGSVIERRDAVTGGPRRL